MFHLRVSERSKDTRGHKGWRAPMSIRRARELLADRSGNVCEICSAARATEWHHRKRRSQGGTWAASNGLHLCTKCHHRVHHPPASAPGRSYSNGWLVRSTIEPQAMPAYLRTSCGQTFVWLYDDGTYEAADVASDVLNALAGKEIT